MLNAAHFTASLRSGLWAECVHTTTYIDNLECDNGIGEPRYKLFYGTDDKRFPYEIWRNDPSKTWRYEPF